MYLIAVRSYGFEMLSKYPYVIMYPNHRRVLIFHQHIVGIGASNILLALSPAIVILVVVISVFLIRRQRRTIGIPKLENTGNTRLKI